jgi:hypothetical protein
MLLIPSIKAIYQIFYKVKKRRFAPPLNFLFFGKQLKI